MASKKDMRRLDLVIPYTEPKDEKESDISGTLASTLPMAAMFTRNKMLGWVSVVFALQTWLAETPEQKRNTGTPSYFAVGMSIMAVGTSYLPLFLPAQPGRLPAAGTGTEAPAAAPPS